MSILKHMTVSGLVFCDGKLLLVDHKKLHTWIYPGGHLEINESPVDGLKREILEETGYSVEVVTDEFFTYIDASVKTIPRPYCVLEETINAEEELPEHKHIDFIYLCRVLSKEKIPSEDIVAKWVSREEMELLYLFDNFRALANGAFDFYCHNKHQFNYQLQ